MSDEIPGVVACIEGRTAAVGGFGLNPRLLGVLGGAPGLAMIALGYNPVVGFVVGLVSALLVVVFGSLLFGPQAVKLTVRYRDEQLLLHVATAERALALHGPFELQLGRTLSNHLSPRNEAWLKVTSSVSTPVVSVVVKARAVPQNWRTGVGDAVQDRDAPELYSEATEVEPSDLEALYRVLQ